ncbi:MAG TPA: response regulator [Caulobacteraceae bacterium]|nr:response regulator [Caulobacteraceae bacterium]
MSALSPETRINLEHSTVLLIDDSPEALEILSSVVRGFGVKQQIKCSSASEAVTIVKAKAIDLIIVDCAMPDMDGYDFVRWLRRDGPKRSITTPVIMLTGHATESRVEKSRDCGANFVVVKPLTPMILLQRITWVARDNRSFVDCDTYAGPDRRVRNLGPPLGMGGRREGDLSAHVGMATEANMDQSEIDMLLNPKRVSL